MNKIFSKSNNLKKGIAYTIPQVMTLLIAVILGGLFYFIPQSQLLRLESTIQIKEVESRTKVLTNSLLNDQNLVYISDFVSEKNTFDAAKLNRNMVKKSSDNPLLSCPNTKALCQKNADPDTFTLVLVIDDQNKNAWYATLKTESKDILDSIECVDNLKKDSLFQPDANLAEALQLENCDLSIYPRINDQGVPVLIKYATNEPSTGLLRVLVAKSEAKK